MNTDQTHTVNRNPHPHLPFSMPYFNGRFVPIQHDVFLSPGVTHHVIAHQGRSYMLRMVTQDLIFFRDTARNLPEWTWFLCAPNITEETLQWTGAEWEKALRSAQVGRCVGCKPGGRYEQSMFTLLFTPDGTGQYYDTRRILDFTWDWRQTILTSPEHLLTADLVDLSLFSPRSFYAHCEDVITHQIAKRLANPYIEPGDLQDKPFAFTCGSEEELKRVTIWACHTETDLFAQHTEYQIIYRSPLEEHGGNTTLHPGITFFPVVWVGDVRLSRRLRTLCYLAYRHNAFSGWQWGYKFNKFKPPARRKGYRQHRGSVDVNIAAPSAHERAEALLALYDWLDGKVSAKRKQRLLGLE